VVKDSAERAMKLNLDFWEQPKVKNKSCQNVLQVVNQDGKSMPKLSVADLREREVSAT